MFNKILIANRGEIACRVIKTARRMGIRTVAVYSEADAGARHVRMADEAVCIGAPPPRESYLVIDRIIAAALATGAQAIHPGYGFLSENEEFAEACAKNGIVFIGPPVTAIRAMGSKSEAKKLMEKAGVPLTPGYHGDQQDPEILKQEADKIGYPVLIKAAAGGGGKGMRAVERSEDFLDALASCQREAQSSFGDQHVLIEKYLQRPRHIEIQVFGDSHGNCVYLFERDCSVQRRHQKVLEEAPAPGMTAERRAAMGKAAVDAARAVGYVGAGTVEFIVNQDGTFYFMEMNTRLQVEHPVTEMITGLDLVEWQIRVARGEPLPLAQDEITATGHAFEARVYAEDAGRGFLPSTGTIRHWRAPAAADGVRVDTGFRAGDTVTPYYDPMLAKLIVHGADRAAALDRLTAALGLFEVAGVTTNLGFLRALATHPDVRAGAMDTGLIERDLDRLVGADGVLAPADLAAAVAAVLAHEAERPAAAPADPWSPWDAGDGWSIAGGRRRKLQFRLGTSVHEAVVVYGRAGPALEGFDAAGEDAAGEDGAGRDGATSLRAVPRGDGRLDVFLGDGKETVGAWWLGRDLELATPRGRLRLHWIDPYAGEDTGASAARAFAAPMPGTVTRVLAAPGDRLARGQAVIVVEAMKMEHTLRAPTDGTLAALACAVGDVVPEGAELAAFEAHEAEG